MMPAHVALQRVPRRRFLRMVAAGAATGGALAMGLWGRNVAAPRVSETRILMGTIVNLIVLGDAAAGRAAAQAALARMAELEAILSRHQAQSQLSRLNRNGRLADPSPAMVDVLRMAESVSRLTGGAFDVTIKPLLDVYQHRPADGSALPMENEIEARLALVGYQRLRIGADAVVLETPGMGVTLDGIAKGYIVDAGVQVLQAHGFADVLVEAGGDMMARGGHDVAKGWRVGVQSPRQEHRGLMASFSVRDRAVATSGDYMQPFSADYRNHHIIDPRTGRSPLGAASVTVAAPTCAQADALATALMVLGPDDGLLLLHGLPGVQALFVAKDLSVIRSDPALG